MSLLGPGLEAFMAIVQHKTVHAAAETLFITQTAVTQRIKALEQKLKTSLFVRTRRGMLLTSEGEALLRYCNIVQNLEGETLANITGAGTKTTVNIRITGPTSIMSSRVIPECIPIMKKFPKLLIHFDVRDIEERHLLLHSGQCDFAILYEENVVPEMQRKVLKPESCILVCPTAWKKRKLKEIIQNEYIIDYDPTDQMTYDYLKHFELFALANHSRYFVNRTSSLAMMISEELGYSTLVKEYAEPYIKQGKIFAHNYGKAYNQTPYLCWYSRPEQPDYFKAIIKAII